jgi:hypothetical protein
VMRGLVIGALYDEGDSLNIRQSRWNISLSSEDTKFESRFEAEAVIIRRYFVVIEYD